MISWRRVPYLPPWWWVLLAVCLPAVGAAFLYGQAGAPMMPMPRYYNALFTTFMSVPVWLAGAILWNGWCGLRERVGGVKWRWKRSKS